MASSIWHAIEHHPDVLQGGDYPFPHWARMRTKAIHCSISDYETASQVAESKGPLQARLMCQFYNRMDITILPPYIPSKVEVQNPSFYAKNVRETMAAAIGLPMVDQVKPFRYLLLHDRNSILFVAV